MTTIIDHLDFWLMECHYHDWPDLIQEFAIIVQQPCSDSLKQTPLTDWVHKVASRVEALPPDEEEIPVWR